MLLWIVLGALLGYAGARVFLGHPPARGYRVLARREVAFLNAAGDAIYPPGAGLPSGSEARVPESLDAYLAIVRLDRGEDPRVFGSDYAFAEESRLGSVLLGDVETPALEIDKALAEAESGAPKAPPTVEPVGDADLLADLGVSAHHLLTLCAREGMLPSDVTAEVAELIGFGDELEELRGL